MTTCHVLFLRLNLPAFLWMFFTCKEYCQPSNGIKNLQAVGNLCGFDYYAVQIFHNFVAIKCEISGHIESNETVRKT